MLNSLHSWGRLRTSDYFASASWLSGMTGLHHQTRKKNFLYVNMWVWNGFIFTAGTWSRIFFIVFYTGRNWGAQKLNDYFKSHGWSNKELDPKLLNSLLLHWVSSVKEERKTFWQQQHSHCEKKACRDHIVQDGYMVMICPVNKSCSSTVEFIVPPGCQSMGHTFKSVTCLLESSRCSSVLESFISGGRSCPMWTGHLCCLQWPVASHHMSLLRVAGMEGL